MKKTMKALMIVAMMIMTMSVAFATGGNEKIQMVQTLFQQMAQLQWKKLLELWENHL